MAIKEKMSDFWMNLSPMQRRVAALGLIFVVAALFFIMASPERKGLKTVSQREDPFAFQEPDIAGEWSEKIYNEVLAQNRQLQDMQQRLNQLEQSGKRSDGTQRQRESKSSTGSSRMQKDISADALMKEIERYTGGSEIVPGQALPHAPVPETPQPAPTTPEATLAPDSSGVGVAGRESRNTRKAKEEEPPAIPRSLGVLSWPSPPPAATAPKNEFESFYVTAPSSFSVFLLNGLDAPTGMKAKNEPVPMMLEVKDLSWLPNGYRQDLKGCFLLAEGIGELSSERVSVRGISISCVSNDGKNVIDQPLLGFLADSDGKAGLRGEVVSKAGKLLAETMKVGFVQGLSEFFQFNARTLTVTDSGAVSSPKNSDFGNAFLGGSATGVSKALDKLANYYMSLAEEIFPVIEIGATRSATFIVTKGSVLTFDKSLTNSKGGGNDL